MSLLSYCFFWLRRFFLFSVSSFKKVDYFLQIIFFHRLSPSIWLVSINGKWAFPRSHWSSNSIGTMDTWTISSMYKIPYVSLWRPWGDRTLSGDIFTIPVQMHCIFEQMYFYLCINSSLELFVWSTYELPSDLTKSDFLMFIQYKNAIFHPLYVDLPYQTKNIYIYLFYRSWLWQGSTFARMAWCLFLGVFWLCTTLLYLSISGFSQLQLFPSYLVVTYTYASTGSTYTLMKPFRLCALQTTNLSPGSILRRMVIWKYLHSQLTR